MTETITSARICQKQTTDVDELKQLLTETWSGIQISESFIDQVIDHKWSVARSFECVNTKTKRKHSDHLQWCISRVSQGKVRTPVRTMGNSVAVLLQIIIKVFPCQKLSKQEIRSVELGVCPMQLFIYFLSRDVHPVQNLLLCTTFYQNRMIFQ